MISQIFITNIIRDIRYFSNENLLNIHVLLDTSGLYCL